MPHDLDETLRLAREEAVAVASAGKVQQLEQRGLLVVGAGDVDMLLRAHGEALARAHPNLTPAQHERENTPKWRAAGIAKRYADRGVWFGQDLVDAIAEEIALAEAEARGIASDLLHLVESVDFFDDRAAGERLAGLRERTVAAGIPQADEDACPCPSCLSLKAARDAIKAPEVGPR